MTTQKGLDPLLNLSSYTVAPWSTDQSLKWHHIKCLHEIKITNAYLTISVQYLGPLIGATTGWVLIELLLRRLVGYSELDLPAGDRSWLSWVLPKLL